MDLITRLIREHQDYAAKLSTLAETIGGIRVNGRGDYFIETLDGLVKPLTTELDDHARREEDFLFPRILQRAPNGPVPVMLAEHAAIRQQSADFGRWYPRWREGDEGAYQPWVDAALNLRGTFSAHMQKENLILFPLARRLFTAGEIGQWMALGER